MVETQEICKTFHDKKRGVINAVDHVTLAAQPGEIFGILGPNGAGKTTLLRMLATILQPTSGTGTIAGFDILTQPEKVRQSIGYLTGTANLYERLSARESIEYFGALYGLTPEQIKQRSEEIIDDLDMREFVDARADKLSTGQKQRVSIARAIIHRPPVLFFDEPTSGLDVVASRTVTRFIRRCKVEGRTVIFSTHIMSEVEAMCDRIAVIYQGKVAAIGTLEELRAQTGKQAFEHVFLKLIGEDED